jgi:acetolactate synthase-1/2/3 large subunit
MAAKHTHPGKEIGCLFGDGAFSLTGWDFETLVRFNLPFIGIVGNNSAMSQIRYGRIQKYGADRGRVGKSGKPSLINVWLDPEVHPRER